MIRIRIFELIFMGPDFFLKSTKIESSVFKNKAKKRTTKTAYSEVLYTREKEPPNMAGLNAMTAKTSLRHVILFRCLLEAICAIV